MGTSLAAEPLLSLAVTVTSEQRVEPVLQSIVQGLASQPGVALARIWLLPSADLSSFCHPVSDSPDCLCLVASAGTPINSPGEDWCFLQGHFARMPFDQGKVGQVAASRNPILVGNLAAQSDWVVRPDWAKREQIQSFAGHPLIFRDRLLGVIGVFSRQSLGQQEFTWLGLFANQAALAIANACAEEALHSSERNLAAIINTIPTGAWTTRPDGYRDFINKVWLDYAGMTSEQAQGWGWADAIHPDDRQKLVDIWQSSLVSGAPVDTETRIRRFDGAYRWFLTRANPLRDESGKIVKWYGTNIDIEDRKQAEEAMRARELDARSLLDNMPGFLGRHSPDGTPEIVNRPFLQYYGKTLEDVQKWETSELVHPDDLAYVIEAFGNGISSGQPWSLELRLRGSDGTYRWFQARWVPVRDAHGRILHWNALTTDIDDRKKAEQALQASERNLTLMIDAIPGMVHTARPDGYLDYFNRRWLDYLGNSLVDIEGWKWTAWIHPDDVQGIVDKWHACLASGETFEYECRVRRSNGEYRWMFHRKIPLRDEHGNIVRWYGASLDIEDRKRTEWLRAAEVHTLQMINDGANLSDVLNDLCATIDKHISASSFIALMDRDGKHLLPFAGPHISPTFATAIISAPIDHSRGSGETAPFAKHPLIIPDISDDQRWPPDTRDLALHQGVCAAWFHPLVAARGEVLGTFCICHSKPRTPGPRDLEFIEAAARIALIAIERQRSQEALRNALDQVQKSESKLRQVIDAIPALAWCNLPDGTNEFLNKPWHEYTGLSPEQSHGWGWQAAFHPEDLPPLMEKWMKMLVSGEPDEIEARLLRHDGVYRWFLIRAEPFRDESGNIVRWYGTSTDIDDRKRAEAQLEQAYLRLAEAQRLSKTGSFIADLPADDHNWSEEAFRIFEFDPATKVRVQTIRNCIHPDDRPSFDAVIARGMVGTDVDFVFRIVTARGALKHIRGLARVTAQNGSRPLFIGAFHDVTESKIAEEALDRARSELAHVARVTTLNAFTASIAHEINQPLSGIITNASTCLRMLNGDPPNVDGARETARRTLRDGNRASDVITQLRGLFSKKDFMLETLDLNELTREVIALSSSDLQRNRVILQSDFAEDLPPVIGDRVQLQQVTLNLLRNASDAMVSVDDRPRHLLVRTWREGNDHVRLSVQDTGTGVDPQDCEKLFEAFYTTKSGGMGIGLSVSRSIIERHHGRLWAEPNDGPGATFSFSIPCDPEAATDAAA